MPVTFKKCTLLTSLIFVSSLWTSNTVQALELDWHGQFRAETNWLFGWSSGQLLNNTSKPPADQGYNVPYNGNSPASFQNLFFRLDPRVLVNDNVTVYSDLWVGAPDNEFFGSDTSTPSGTTAGQFYSTSTGNATLSMHEFYAEIATDFGIVHVGRMPLNWGLGVVWNNMHDAFDRLPSTGDVVGLVTKFGAFKFMPAFVKYRLGSDLGGTYNGSSQYTGGTTNTTSDGWSGAADYTLGITYENTDEQMDAGLMFMRRLSGVNAEIINPLSGVGANTLSPGYSSYSYNIWDFYLKKKANIFTVAAEVPLVSGQIQGVNYSTVAVAVQTKAQINENWSVKFNFGQASGQSGVTSGQTPSTLTAFYFHPDYRPALIMFNYNLRSFSYNSTGASPYNNPLTDARYFSLGADYTIGKWDCGLNVITAAALQTADGVSGDSYFNTWDGYYHVQNVSGPAQGSNLGLEFDYNMAYQWDEAVRVGLGMGLLSQGNFYAFSNSATQNPLKSIFLTELNLSVKF